MPDGSRNQNGLSGMGAGNRGVECCSAPPWGRAGVPSFMMHIRCRR